MLVTAAAPRVPPHNLEAEESVLGAMLLSRDAIAAAAASCSAEDFYKPAHAHVFAAITALYSRGEPADPVTVADELRRCGLADAVGDPAVLVSLQVNTPSTANAGHYARIVEEHARLRRLQALGFELACADSLAAATAAAARVGATADAAGPAAADRLKSGARFVLDDRADLDPLWGSGDQVLWARGEELLIVGPAGVGKTTLALQLVGARLGLVGDVLGMPVAQAEGRVLYLALDRPMQVRRAMRRLWREEHRAVLEDRLLVWEGPLPADLGRRPETLLALARQAKAGTVVVDSLKDASVKLSDDEVGGNTNRAVQHALAEGVDVLALHHQRKAQNGARPTSLDDVYGSTWLTAGAGSVVLLWGAPGDPIVELTHLKQPAGEVGPLQVEHDHLAGTSMVFRGHVDPLVALRHAPHGLTSVDLARAMFEVEKPTDNQRKKAQRQLDRLVRDGRARRVADYARNPVDGNAAARYAAAPEAVEAP